MKVKKKFSICFNKVQVTFEGVIGDGWQGDIAIDDVAVRLGKYKITLTPAARKITDTATPPPPSQTTVIFVSEPNVLLKEAIKGKPLKGGKYSDFNMQPFVCVYVGLVENSLNTPQATFSAVIFCQFL